MRDVTLSTWNWRHEEPAVSATPGTSMRRAAWLQAAVLGLVGLVLDRVLGHALPARIVWGLAAVVALLGAVWPRGYRPIHAFGQALGHWVGKLLALVLLVPLYVLLFGAVALWLRLRRRDPMHRFYLDGRWTYWIPRREKARDENIGDQFLREDREARGSRRPVGAATRVDGSGPA